MTRANGSGLLHQEVEAAILSSKLLHIKGHYCKID